MNPKVKRDHSFQVLVVHAWFFGSIGHRVDSLTIGFPGANRMRAALFIPDISEETGGCITEITLDGKLAGKPSVLESPAWIGVRTNDAREAGTALMVADLR